MDLKKKRKASSERYSRDFFPFFFKEAEFCLKEFLEGSTILWSGTLHTCTTAHCAVRDHGNKRLPVFVHYLLFSICHPVLGKPCHDTPIKAKLTEKEKKNTFKKNLFLGGWGWKRGVQSPKILCEQPQFNILVQNNLHR